MLETEHIKRILLLVLLLAAASLPVLMLYHVAIGGASLSHLMIAWAVFHIGALIAAVGAASCLARIDRRRQD
jgi:high-affinity K+ transport system ATPase subunit B